MNDSRKNYKRKVETKRVDFYIHERALYDFANSINFAQFVKNELREERERRKVENDGAI